MSRFARLRRSVALFICPEMGVEARLKTIRAAKADPHQTAGSAPTEPFLHPDHMAELLATLRHGRIERAKEILKVVQAIQLDGLPSNEDPAFDALAQRLSILIFGQK